LEVLWERPGDAGCRFLFGDAVVGQFSASDFIGGGAGGQGHRFAFTYMLAKNVAAGLTYFMDEFDRPRIEDEDYDRVEIDLGIKF
jgi:hypothetical protein